MSRAGQSWGIPLPFDPASVVYVWFDALINYAAAVGYGWDDERFQRVVAGQPALRRQGHHPLPLRDLAGDADEREAAAARSRCSATAGSIFKGERMSKSLGNIVDPLDAAKRFGPDPLRLYLAKEVPYGGDGDFTWERFEEKYNADLANNLGNLVNRVASMTERYRQGTLTAPSASTRVVAAGHRRERRREPTARRWTGTRCTRRRRRRSGW